MFAFSDSIFSALFKGKARSSTERVEPQLQTFLF